MFDNFDCNEKMQRISRTRKSLIDNYELGNLKKVHFKGARSIQSKPKKMENSITERQIAPF